MQEDLSRAGVRFIPELDRAYFSRIGLQPELSRLLKENGAILLSTDLGLLSISPKPTDERIVLARFNGCTPKTKEQYKLVCEVIDNFKASRQRSP